MSQRPLILSSLALAVALAIGAGYFYLHRSKPGAATSASGNAHAPAAKVEPAEEPPATPTPWNGPEKDAALARIERLTPAEAEYLCFTLSLIPRDEVFEKVNVKGRLVRYINGLSDASELRDFNRAIREMAKR